MRYHLRAPMSLLALLFLLLAALACTPQAAEAPPTEIRVGFIAPMSGEYADTSGRTTLNGAQLAVEQINASGGVVIAGTSHPLVLIQGDDQGSAEAAVAEAQRLINQEEVVAIVGAPFSSVAIPVAEVAESAHVPLISSTSTNPKTTEGKQYAFRVAFIDPFQGRVMATFARNELEVQRAAVLYDVANDYNRGVAEVFKAAFEEAGGEVVAFESYTSDQNQDFTEQLERIKAEEPEVLLLPNLRADVPLQVQQARELGIEATLLGTDGWSPSVFGPDPLFEGAYFSKLWSPALETEKTPAFIAAYQEKYGEAPNENAALTYDAVGLLTEAMRKQGSTEPEAIRDGLAAIGSYTGVSGTMVYEGSGDPARSAVILQFKGGEAVFHQAIQPEGAQAQP